tara:strand:+ start:57 stop:476 length:420 start_codon:yes stop_codon:yes gene_type:complete
LARFRKYWKKQDLNTKTEEIEEYSTEKLEEYSTEKLESVITKDPSIRKETAGKSWITSGTKYAYIIAIAALMSGVFTPFTLGIEHSIVLSGILILLVGLSGGVLIFKGIKRDNPSKILILGGLGLMIISLILIQILGSM